MNPTTGAPAQPPQFNVGNDGPTAVHSRRARAVLGGLAAVWLATYAWRLLASGLPAADVPRVGMLAAGVAEHVGLPLAAYRATDYTTSGHLTYGLLLTPIYCLFGSRFLWIVLLASSLVVLGLAGWAAAVHRGWGFSGAALFLLLCIGPPPYFERCSHFMLWGSHLETVFFSGATLCFFLPRRPTSPGFWPYAALGLLAAWGGFADVQNLPLIATLIVLAVWRHRWRGVYRLAWPAAPLFLCFCGMCRLLFGAYLYLPTGVPTASGYAQDVGAKLDRLFFSALPGLFRRNPGDWPEADAWHIWLLRYPAVDRALSVVSSLFYGLALAGLLLVILAALFGRSDASAGRRGWGPSLIDPRQRQGGSADEKLWLARFIAVLFAAWVAGCLVAKFRMPAGDQFRRYALPMYPLLLASFCYALALLPGVLRWPTALPFCCLGLVNLCGPLIWPSCAPPPAETWRELNARRGDDFAGFIEDIWSVSWWDDSGGSEWAIPGLPRRWRQFAWIKSGLHAHGNPADEWRQRPDEPAEPAEPRALIARGRGEAIGKQICSVGGHSAESLPAGNMAPPTAAAFFVGVGYGCASAKIGLSLDPAPEASAALRLAQRRIGLTPRQSWEAFMTGAASRVSERKQAPYAAAREALCRTWAPVFSVDNAACGAAAFDHGWAEGEAVDLMNRCREVLDASELTSVEQCGAPHDWPMVRATLRRWGVETTPTDKAGRRFVLTYAE